MGITPSAHGSPLINEIESLRVVTKLGHQIGLKIGPALMANPDMILLGMTILLADHNLKLCRRVCERGCIVHEGTMEAIWSDEEVIKKYLVL